MVQARKEPNQAVQKTNAGDTSLPDNRQPRSIGIAAAGIQTSRDFAHLMSAIMSDVIEGMMTPSVAHAAVNAGGKLLKVVEMQQKYGTVNPNGQGKMLVLSGDDSPSDPKEQAKASLQEQIAEAQRKLDQLNSEAA